MLTLKHLLLPTSWGRRETELEVFGGSCPEPTVKCSCIYLYVACPELCSLIAFLPE